MDIFLKRLDSLFLEPCVYENTRCCFTQLSKFISNACIFKCTALTFSVLLMSFPGNQNQGIVTQHVTNLSLPLCLHLTCMVALGPGAKVQV